MDKVKGGLVSKTIKSFESIFLDDTRVLQRGVFSSVHKLNFVTGYVTIFGKIAFCELFWLSCSVDPE